MKVISVIFGHDTVMNQMPMDELNENIDLLLEDMHKGAVYTSKTTGSKIKQVSDLFIDCERDDYGEITYVKLIRLVETDGQYTVRTIAQLDNEYCTI